MCIWIYLIKPRTECFEELVQWIVEEIRVEIPLFHVTVYYVKKLRYLIYFQSTENHVACQPLPEIFTHDDNHQLKNNT